MRGLIAVAAACAAAPALAHADEASAAWIEPWAAGGLLISLALYVTGATRLWRRAGAGRGITLREAACFAGGWSTLLASLAGPLEAWSHASFAAHMLQHEAMMLVAAPLLAASRPLAAFAWALPPAVRHALHAMVAAGGLRRAWRVLTSPLWATILALAVVWIWHVPRLFDLAGSHRGWHALQHATFLLTSLAYWWALRPMPRARHAIATVASLFVATIVTGALGALLTFAATPWYAVASAAGPFAATPVEDQQMGGLLMWIPGGVVYLVVASMRMRDAVRGDARAHGPCARRSRTRSDARKSYVSLLQRPSRGA